MGRLHKNHLDFWILLKKQIRGSRALRQQTNLNTSQLFLDGDVPSILPQSPPFPTISPLMRP